MTNQKYQEREEEKSRGNNYSLCRASCSVCPYHEGWLKLLDHAVKIKPTLPQTEPEQSAG